MSTRIGWLARGKFVQEGADIQALIRSVSARLVMTDASIGDEQTPPQQ
jgi:hypothetical protein